MRLNVVIAGLIRNLLFMPSSVVSACDEIPSSVWRLFLLASGGGVRPLCCPAGYRLWCVLALG